MAEASKFFTASRLITSSLCSRIFCMEIIPEKFPAKIGFPF
jgi:hypothetical protein